MSRTQKRLVSVLMPVHNGENHVSVALKSILCQSYRNLQVIIVDDGSSDRTVQEIGKTKDSRVQTIVNDRNMGIVESLNKGVACCKGEFIARMDADDISIEDRIEKQVKFMVARPICICVGSRYRILGSSAIVNVPLEHSDICVQLWESSPICHPAALIRRRAFETLQYEKAFQYAEDYKLWSDLSDMGELQNLPEPLLEYRIHPNQIARTHVSTQKIVSDKVRIIQLRRLVGDIGHKQKDLHLSFIHGSRELNSEDLASWTTALIYQNSLRKVMHEPAFTRFLLRKFSDCIGSDGRKSFRDLVFDRMRRRFFSATQ